MWAVLTGATMHRVLLLVSGIVVATAAIWALMVLRRYRKFTRGLCTLNGRSLPRMSLYWNEHQFEALASSLRVTGPSSVQSTIIIILLIFFTDH
jgi:hypothetical protein